jgi:FemAB-related protein (PEP-CTERM system-associated)
MPYEIVPLTDSEKPNWDTFVESCPEATFFHDSGWKDVVEKSFGHKTYFALAKEDNRVRGVLPLVNIKSLLFGNTLISNACCMGGGVAAENDIARGKLDEYADQVFSETKADFLEFRQPPKLHDDWPRRADLYATFERTIEQDEADNLKQIPRKQRAVVRKALKSELTDGFDESIDDFFDLYALSVRNLGTPVFSRKYFENLISCFPGNCDILTIRLDGRPISSVLSFYFRDRVMPYYTGSIPEARRLGANDFMYWRLMRHAIERGYSVFDFGRSKLGTGPFSFKKNWGFEPKDVVHEFKLRDGAELPNLTPTNPKYQLFIAMWKRLPVPIANAIGPHIVKNIG